MISTITLAVFNINLNSEIKDLKGGSSDVSTTMFSTTTNYDITTETTTTSQPTTSQPIEVIYMNN